MGMEADWCLEAVRGLTREQGIALLDRAAEVGLLNPYGNGYYGIHPALPWYFRAVFEQYYGDAGGGESSALRARRAFVEAIGTLGNYYGCEYESGNRDVLAVIAAEEDNLLAAWRLARANGWWHRVICAMQGLRTLYHDTGRAAWRRLVAAIAPEFVDPVTDGPLLGREEHWSLISEYRVRIAREDRQWRDAERLQRLRVAWDRTRAADALALPSARWGKAERNCLRTLAVSVDELGEIRRELGDPACVDASKESLDLAERIGDRPFQAVCAYNLGTEFKNLPPLRDLNEAERWYRTSLDLRDLRDGLGRARCLGQLGSVALARFEEARAVEDPEDELRTRLNSALDLYQQALALLPETAVADWAIVHNALGVIYIAAGDVDRALRHFRTAIGYREHVGNLYGAGRTRFNVAQTLWGANRFADALAYAKAALANFQTFGDRAADMIDMTQRLIADIQQAQQQQSGGTP
jgi:tetratricopeptide (TPR) repeat protein